MIRTSSSLAADSLLSSSNLFKLALWSSAEDSSDGRESINTSISLAVRAISWANRGVWSANIIWLEIDMDVVILIWYGSVQFPSGRRGLLLSRDIFQEFSSDKNMKAQFWYQITLIYDVLHNRAAQILGGFLPQTPLLSLTQTVSPYQFSGP